MEEGREEEVLQYPNPGNGTMNDKPINFVIKSFGRSRDKLPCIVELSLGQVVYRCEPQCSCSDLAGAQEVVFTHYSDPDHVKLYCPTIRGCASDAGLTMRPVITRWDAFLNSPQQVVRLRTGSFQMACPVNVPPFVDFTPCKGVVNIVKPKTPFFVSIAGHYLDAQQFTAPHGAFVDFRLRLERINDSGKSVAFFPDQEGSRKYLYASFSRLEEFTFLGVCTVDPGEYSVQLQIRGQGHQIPNTYFWESVYGHITVVFS